MNQRTVLFVDISPVKGQSTWDFLTTLAGMDAQKYRSLFLPLKSAFFSKYMDTSHVEILDVHSRDWKDMWVVNESINRHIRPRLLDGIYRRWLYRQYNSTLTEALEDMLHDETIHIIHLNNFDFRITPVLNAAARRNVPTIVHVRSFRRMAANEIRSLSKAEMILCISEAVRERLCSQLPIRYHHKLKTWYNGIDFDDLDQRMAASNAREELSIPPEKHVVGLLGRISPHKGHEVFLESMARVLAAYPRAHALIGGKYSYRDRNYVSFLKGRARDAGLEDHVSFANDLDRLEQVLAACDLVVNPALHSDPVQGIVEPFSRIVVEAMGLGLPVAATRAGGIPEAIEDGITGLLVEPGNPEALAEAVLGLLSDPDKASAMGARASIAVRGKYASDVCLAQLEASYDKILS